MHWDNEIWDVGEFWSRIRPTIRLAREKGELLTTARKNNKIVAAIGKTSLAARGRALAFVLWQTC